MNVLIVEDGTEYTDTLTRFAPSAAVWERAGDGASALARLQRGGVDALFLDMRFDRVADHALLGDLEATTERFGGDRARAVHFLQENQGTLVIAAIRAAGHQVPVLFSYNFDEEPRRWSRLHAAHAPVAYVADSVSPAGIVERLTALATAFYPSP